MSSSWEKICIIGVGLLGGSIGLAVRARNLARQVVGVCRNAATGRDAMNVGAVHATVASVAEGCEGADLVIVCTPVQTVPPILEEVHQFSGPETLIVDVGSTKSAIAKRAVELGLSRFVPSHPLAGSERSGVSFARADLFEDRPCIVTPTSLNAPDLVEQVLGFWRSLGASVSFLSPEEHDQIVARTSHLPHLVASALAAGTPSEVVPFLASGWADTTRVAAGNPEMWCQIVEENREPILSVMKNFATIWQDWIAAIEGGDRQRLYNLLETGKAARDALGNRYSSEGRST